jgi:hypothetical protein
VVAVHRVIHTLANDGSARVEYWLDNVVEWAELPQLQLVKYGILTDPEYPN